MSNNRDNVNVAAMREALESAENELWSRGAFDESKKCAAALSAPARNCDVGTAEEQERRYEKFCDSHKWVDDDGANACSSQCPLYNALDCALHWAQMPYGKGDPK